MFRNPHRWLLFLICSCSLSLQAQIIRGNVRDAKTLEPLPFANVFINNTTIGVVTDLKGNFALSALRNPGSYELVVSFVGYESFKSDINVGVDEVINADIKLIPSELELNNVVVRSTRDLAWEKDLKKFEKIFLGKDKLAESCKILNPWVIDFVNDPVLKKFTASATDPIEIYNNALGYKVMFYLNVFWSDKTSYFISGNVRFEEMQGYDERERTMWEKNRRDSYLHSSHHLFKAMVDSRIRGEGFQMYTERPDYENVTVRSANFNADLGKLVVPYDTSRLVSTAGQTGLYKIKWKGRAEVHYLKERAAVRTYRDIPYQVSWIRLSKDSVIVNRDGFELNPADVIVSGEMSSDRVARMLPADYQPGKYTPPTEKEINETVLSLFQEKTYVQTDKPYYYPGEPLWLKGYLNYRTPGLRDSMSRTAYVEFIHPSRKIVDSRVMAVDSGFFYGDFVLPDTLSAGTYYLRAHTNFSRNFGAENIFIKPIPILQIREKVKPNFVLQPTSTMTGLTIETDKNSYKPREKVTLTIRVKDEDDVPMLSNVSLSVTDASQVIPIEAEPTILTHFAVGEIKKELARKDFQYAIESGVTFYGQFLNAKNKPEEATLNVFQLTPPNFTMTRSDSAGNFAVRDVTFYDTAEFTIQSINRKGEPYGKGILVKRETLPLDFASPDYPVEIIRTETPQRVFSEYEVPKGTTLLEAIEVRATRLVQEDSDYRLRRPYGKPDFVLTAKDLTTGYGNLLYTLPGKIPGLIVRQISVPDEPLRWVVYLQRATSIMFPGEVLVMVNNSIVGGSPADILGNINPDNVESIEVKKGVNVLFGFYGSNGVLAIYTKDGSGFKKDFVRIPTLKTSGYSRPRKFRFPNYSDQNAEHPVDFRALVYWNPEVETDPTTGTATVSFYTTDLPGQYNIIAEGVAQNGKPIRCVSLISVK